MGVFVIIKPDAIVRGLVGKIIERFERKDLWIERVSIRRKNSAWCREHYAHLPDDIFRVIEVFMCSSELIGIVFKGDRAHAIANKLVGSTDSVEAEPGTIRGDYGSTPIMRNVIHVSDSYDDSKREISLFFNNETDQV